MQQHLRQRHLQVAGLLAGRPLGHQGFHFGNRGIFFTAVKVQPCANAPQKQQILAACRDHLVKLGAGGIGAAQFGDKLDKRNFCIRSGCIRVDFAAHMRLSRVKIALINIPTHQRMIHVYVVWIARHQINQLGFDAGQITKLLQKPQPHRVKIAGIRVGGKPGIRLRQGLCPVFGAQQITDHNSAGQDQGWLLGNQGLGRFSGSGLCICVLRVQPFLVVKRRGDGFNARVIGGKGYGSCGVAFHLVEIARLQRQFNQSKAAIQIVRVLFDQPQILAVSFF